MMVMKSMNKKYKLLTEDTIKVDGRILYRIESLINFSDIGRWENDIYTDKKKTLWKGNPTETLRSFGYVRKGEKGGYIEKESNLSHEGFCWVYENAKVFENGVVSGDACAYGDSCVRGNAKLYDYAAIFDHSEVCDEAKVYGYATVNDHSIVSKLAKVYGYAYIYGSSEISCKMRIGGHTHVYDDIVISAYSKTIRKVLSWIKNTNY